MTNLDLERKAQLMRDQLDHIGMATKAREYLNSRAAQAKALVSNAKLEPHEPQTGPEMAHYGFDFAQQVFNVNSY